MNALSAIFISSLIVFSSCSDRQFYKSYSVKIDSLNASLEATASTYVNLDTTLISSQYFELRKNTDSLKQFPDAALNPTVVRYRYVQKKYKTILRDHPINIRELNYCRQQLADLKFDFKKGKPEVKKALEYYKTEEEAVVFIKKRMSAYQALIDESMQKFKTLNPEIAVLLDSLSKTEQN